MMTNRIDYQLPVIVEPKTKGEEVIYLAELLAQLRRPVTLDQAKEVLAFALENAPGAWLIGLGELEEYWNRIIEPVLA